MTVDSRRPVRDWVGYFVWLITRPIAWAWRLARSLVDLALELWIPL